MLGFIVFVEHADKAPLQDLAQLVRAPTFVLKKTPTALTATFQIFTIALPDPEI